MAGSIPDSSSVHWNTPENVLAQVRAVLGQIELDPCSNASSTVGALNSFCWPESDGLLADWTPFKTAFVNPPYGRVLVNLETKQMLLPKEAQELEKAGESIAGLTVRDITDWHKKCIEFAEAGGTAIELIPAAVNSIKGWHSMVFPKSAAFCFLRGRPKFVIQGRPSSTGTQEIAAVLWTKDKTMVQSFKQAFSKIGFTVRRI